MLPVPAASSTAVLDASHRPLEPTLSSLMQQLPFLELKPKQAACLPLARPTLLPALVPWALAVKLPAEPLRGPLLRQVRWRFLKLQNTAGRRCTASTQGS
jgi:hypothetical protein